MRRRRGRNLYTRRKENGSFMIYRSLYNTSKPCNFCLPQSISLENRRLEEITDRMLWDIFKKSFAETSADDSWGLCKIRHRFHVNTLLSPVQNLIQFIKICYLKRRINWKFKIVKTLYTTDILKQSKESVNRK